MKVLERKNKYLGFRIAHADYMQTLQVAERLGVSISDFILSALLPHINKVENEIDKESKMDILIGEDNAIIQDSMKKQSNTRLNLKNDFDKEIEEKLKKYSKTLNQLKNGNR